MNEFWVFNFSDRCISIKDLNLIIRSDSLYYLSNKKMFNYTIDQLKKSQYYGSLSFKRDRVLISHRAPEFYDDCIVVACEDLIDQKDLDEYNEAV